MSSETEIRPFRVDVPEEEVAELRRRIAATRWPDRETVADQSQGVQLAKLQDLVTYWGTGYDWRRFEAELNALPQFATNLDGLDIHFIHVRSRHENALPLIMTHGWPGSIVELLKTVSPLTDPTAHGGRAEDAFDLVLPSMPGYGFSERPASAGWDPGHIARAWAELMERLGYTRYVAQGGDWGAVVAEAMARQAPQGLLGIHINLPATVPPEVEAALAVGGPAPAGLSEQERADGPELTTRRRFLERGPFLGPQSQPPDTHDDWQRWHGRSRRSTITWSVSTEAAPTALPGHLPNRQCQRSRPVTESRSKRRPAKHRWAALRFEW